MNTIRKMLNIYHVLFQVYRHVYFIQFLRSKYHNNDVMFDFSLNAKKFINSLRKKN